MQEDSASPTSHAKDFEFYAVCNEKLLKDFKQGSNMVPSVLFKTPAIACTVNWNNRTRIMSYYWESIAAVQVGE